VSTPSAGATAAPQPPNPMIMGVVEQLFKFKPLFNMAAVKARRCALGAGGGGFGGVGGGGVEEGHHASSGGCGERGGCVDRRP